MPSPPLAVSIDDTFQVKDTGKRTRIRGSLRSHDGNAPKVLPQDKQCPHCSARFTRSTHLNRHLKTHLDVRKHLCTTCGTGFTRNDLLARHRTTCNEEVGPKRRSCLGCTKSKTKCNREQPCNRCVTGSKDCIYPSPKRRTVTHSRKVSSFSDAGESSRALLDEPGRIIPPPESTFSDYGSVSASEYTTSYTETTDTLTGLDLPTSNDFASLYRGDVFESLFSDVFGQSPPNVTSDSTPAHGEAFNYATEGLQEDFPFDFSINTMPQNPGASLDWIGNGIATPQNLIPTPASQDAPDIELNHYLYLFLSVFLPQMPLVHVPTFTLEGKPSVYLDAVRACGALFIKTRKAAAFVDETLTNVRDVLLQELASSANDDAYTRNLLTATVLLQTVGLFHQVPSERHKSSVFHGVLIMMIRRNSLLQTIGSYVPRINNTSDIESAWREWVVVESCKRALTTSFLHDRCQEIYFATPPCFQLDEMTIHLPCEDALWTASSAAEWYAIAHTPSSYGPPVERLRGQSLKDAMNSLCTSRQLDSPIMMTPFGLFVMVHAILCDLYITCTRKSLQKTVHAGPEIDPDILKAQYGLHNMLICWVASPDVLSHTPTTDEEPPFFYYALPFYWLGQISLLALREQIPPFDGQAPDPSARFRLTKHWLKYIRKFLKSKDSSPTLLWHNLQKIQLHSSEDEIAGVSGEEDPEGLVGFFDEH